MSRQNMTVAQKQRLVDIMSTKKDLRSGKFTENFSKKAAQKEWEEIAAVLNALPGSNKSWQAWRKSWQDLLSKTKSKKAQSNHALNRTGGGSAEAPILNETEEVIVGMLNPRIIEGHSQSEESEVSFSYNTSEAQKAMQVEGMQAEVVQVDLENLEEDPMVVVEIVSDETNQPDANNATPPPPPLSLSQVVKKTKKINLKTLMKEKVEIKKKLAEAKIKFYKDFLENMEKQTNALQEVARALQEITSATTSTHR